MFVCTTVLYEYMKSFRNDINHLVGNVHVRIICHKFYHGIIYTAYEAHRLLAAVPFYRFHINISLHTGWSCLFTLT